MSRTFLVLLIGVCYALSKPHLTSEESKTLKLVHVLFRHGDRTNIVQSLYPTDPHINETYYPYGLGGLTNEGKRREFRLGKALRQRYGSFLGNIYTPDLLEATSSDTDRTKASLQLVLAGLFPPVDKLIWYSDEEKINWQPIPFKTFPDKQDTLLFGIFCSKAQKLIKEHRASPKVTEELGKNRETFDYLSKHSGWNVTDYSKVFFLYLGLKVEQENGLVLPEWSKKVFPEVLESLAIQSYGLLTGTTELRRFASGFLLKKILDDTNAKIRDELVPRNRKIFLYSGHEFNIAMMLQTLDLFKPHLPSYGSHLIFELHQIDQVYGIKIFYQNYKTEDPEILKLDACDEFCPLDKFVALIEEFLPTPEDGCT